MFRAINRHCKPVISRQSQLELVKFHIHRRTTRHQAHESAVVKRFSFLLITSINMGRGSILSLGLFVLPIAITTGVLVGLDAFRQSTGQPRLFRNNKVNVDIYCQQAFGIHPTTDGQDYTCESIYLSPVQPYLAPVRSSPYTPSFSLHDSTWLV
jgi:hypothetical protein